MWVLKLLLGLAGAYAGLALLLFLAQTWLLFPSWMLPRNTPPLPPDARRLTLAAADGTPLAGVYYPAPPGSTAQLPWLLVFGGNGWRADDAARFFRELLPAHAVVAFDYRGYRPSGGRPSTRALCADGIVVYDYLRQELGAGSVIGVGISLGTGVAAHLAARRPVHGLVLVSPFDSLARLAAGIYWWLPVRALLRHELEVAADLRRSEVPAAIIAGSADRIVPPQRTAPVRHAARQLVLDRTIEGAGHNDLFGRPEFVAALREAVARMSAGGPARRPEMP